MISIGIKENTAVAGEDTFLYRQIKYFKNLNAMRFIAAFLVVMQHAETIRRKNGLYNFEGMSLFTSGPLAVSFFFVLSGFLITYLLLHEHEKTGKISVRNFYMRRILRIWPLYFLLVFLGTIAIPFILDQINYPYEMPYNFKDVWYLFVFFVPFVVNYRYGHNFLEPLWSIGVEELFYILWAPVVLFFRKYIVHVFWCIILIKAALLMLAPLWFDSFTVQTIGTLQFEAMAIGGLGACWLFYRKSPVSVSPWFSQAIQLLVFQLLIARVGFHTYWQNSLLGYYYNALFVHPVISGFMLYVLFLYVILNFAANEKSLVTFENKITAWLGEISYGIYMYHMLVVFALMLFLKPFLHFISGGLATLIYYTVILAGALAVSYLSKRFYEDYFLRLKKKFGKISKQNS